MAKVTINGKEFEVKDGTNLVDAAEQNGIDIPHYCYHPGLSIAGQCRMCMVEQEGNPKLQIACNMRCQDGMKVVTNSDKVKDAVKWNLEFHLINHPIDCPICDQAGECGLQDYYMKHGKYESEMYEHKVLKKKVVDLGENVMLDKERCILCSRCVRYSQEVSKTREFAIFNRGDRSTIGTMDDQPLSGNYQTNVVDICPVGALTSKDFRFEQRVWFLDETESVCSGCSKGCNVYVHHKKERHIYRLKPRFNEAVNTYWMCDKGRPTYKDSNYDRRLTHSKLGGVELPLSEAIQTWASDLKTLIATERNDEIGVWLSPHQTNEELGSILNTFQQVFRVSKFYSEDVETLVKNDNAVDGFLLRSDPYPNSRGFLETFKNKKAKLHSQTEFIQAIESEALNHIVIICPEGERPLSMMARVSQALKPNQFAVVLTPSLSAIQIFPTALGIPTLSHYEKSGTMVNHAGLAQPLLGGIRMFKEARPVEEVLNLLVNAQMRPASEAAQLGRTA